MREQKWKCTESTGLFVVRDENGEKVASGNDRYEVVRLALLAAAAIGSPVTIVDGGHD